eukprot:GAFH01001331.1.p2 GENE.GAFH01001331.1~~GAFH01001331.1.p2  ORF type:complete len:508 (+),score=152.05 GAFH01001331.1:91-1524(+)
MDRPGLTALRQQQFTETTEALPRETLRTKPIGLPGLSEPTVMRHYVKLSQKNFSLDTGMYPLGSCTMKFNPRINEAMAHLPGFAEIHPLQPTSTVQGALQAMHLLGESLMKITGMGGVCLSGGAGSHGELIGLMTIHQAHICNGQDEKRKVVLVPTSAHGTNPASAATCGYKIRNVELNPDGTVNLDDLRANLAKGDVAAFMLTNPSTVGMFEPHCAEMAQLVHEAGAYFYMDGANFNAIMGRVKPRDLGVDVMHLNLHKSFSTPHGGGGPGSGPIVMSDELAQYAPVPKVIRRGTSYNLVEEPDEKCLGRVKGFHGQIGVCVRGLAYILAMGEEGLRNVSGDAVLNANYILARLKNVLSPAYPGRLCMHECLFSDEYLKDTGVTTLDMAKALIDEGYHPPTMYFPLVVHGALLVEPSENESRETLDTFCDIMTKLVERVKAGEVDYFKQAPVHAPIRRADETTAAVEPILTYQQGK